MAEVTKYKITEAYLHLSCGLGEAPFWESEKNTLRFVDIVKQKVHFVNLAEGPSSHKQWNLDFSIGITADIEGNDEEFVFGGKLGYGIANRETGATRWIKHMWTDEERKADRGGKPKAGKNKEERMRSNDGAIDSEGRFFVGTMNDPALVGQNFTNEGILFRLDSDLSLHRVKENVTIPNGISWAPGNRMYFTDSPTGSIVAYPYNASTSAVDWDKGTTFFTCPIQGGVPDGHCQDEYGFLWVACHGTGKVFRIAPDGRVVAEIECPTRCVTCPAFCGTELYITSAAEEEPDKYPWSTKHAGALFKIDVGVRGRPLNKFRMTVQA